MSSRQGSKRFLSLGQRTALHSVLSINNVLACRVQDASSKLKNVIATSVQPGPTSDPPNPKTDPQTGTLPELQAGVPPSHIIWPLEQYGIVIIAPEEELLELDDELLELEELDELDELEDELDELLDDDPPDDELLEEELDELEDEVDDVDEVEAPHINNPGWQSDPSQQSGIPGNPGRHFSVYDWFEQNACCPFVQKTIPLLQKAPPPELEDDGQSHMHVTGF